MSYEPDNSIKCWAEDDRPREKLIHKGKSHLSDSELLGIVLRSGTRSQSAVELAKSVLKSCNNRLDDLSSLSVESLSKIKGVGLAKACSLVAAFELGVRRHNLPGQEQKRIQSSKNAFELLKGDFFGLQHEEFWLLILSRSNNVLAKKRISQGGISGTVADSKLIFKYCLDVLGSSIIVFHNHPSGNIQPSQADIELTKKIKQGALNLDIQLLDHLIIYNDIFYSFADEGIL